MSEEGVMVDWEQVDMIADGFSPEFIDILRELASETPGLLGAIDAAVAASDLEGVARLAHQVKGSAANFGFAGLSRAARQIENLAKAGNTADLPAALADARRCFAAGMDELRGRHTLDF